MVDFTHNFTFVSKEDKGVLHSTLKNVTLPLYVYGKITKVST